MNWSTKLYIGDRVREKADEIREQIDHGCCRGKYEIISLSVKESELIEIRPARQTDRDWVREYCPLIVGLAASHKEAIELTRKMVEDCLRDTGSLSLKEYLSC